MKALPPYPLKLQLRLFLYAIGLILSVCTVLFAGFFIFLGQVVLYKIFALAWLIAGSFIFYRMILALGSGNKTLLGFEFDAFVEAGDYETWTVPEKTAEVLVPYLKEVLARELKITQRIGWVLLGLSLLVGLGGGLITGQIFFLFLGLAIGLVGGLASFIGPKQVLANVLNRLKSRTIYANGHIWAWGGVATEINSVNNRINSVSRMVIPELDNWILYAVSTKKMRGRNLEYRWGFVLISPEQAEAWGETWHRFLKIKN